MALIYLCMHSDQFSVCTMKDCFAIYCCGGSLRIHYLLPNTQIIWQHLAIFNFCITRCILAPKRIRRKVHCKLAHSYAFSALESITGSQSLNWVAMSGNVPSDMCAEWTCAHSRILIWIFTERIFWIDMNAKFRLADDEDWSDCTHAQAYLSLCSAHMLEGTFPYVAA